MLVGVFTELVIMVVSVFSTVDHIDIFLVSSRRVRRRRRRNYLFKQALSGDINIEILKTDNSSQNKTTHGE